ncbi:endolytic transglycosylase MltG [Clostridium gasigenes]|uniref:endolytic transglycosylase MltG n=1 Tax=Clostridium gasigenes TaxID=94869 RepID=UPI001C0CC172|nr:endolytic transglycosylase MltG [Clostridium gasigenes]MBU3107258.1 endolytic transglycosylase MltG [Clostridium gasigenes]
MNILKNKKIVIIMFIVILITVSFIFFNKSLKHPLKSDKDIIINVKTGDSFYSLLNKLQENNQINGVGIIKTYIKVTNTVVDVKPGEYNLHNDMSVKDIINTLNNGLAVDVIDITIQEGSTIDEIANKLEINGMCAKDEFIKAVVAYPLPSYIKQSKIKRYDLEGFLFPDTYKFSKQSSPEEIISKMLERFEDVWQSTLREANIKVANEDVEKVITIASMIEKEAIVNEERAVIASVIYNRLNIDMKLKIDATVIYAMGYHVKGLSYENLEIESPYNTYIIDGLPVGPISNPGIPSILGALKPEKTDYLFYVLPRDGSNRHYFTNNDVDFMNKLEEFGYEP